MRNGELECMCRSPDMRCSLQGAIEQQKQLGRWGTSQNAKTVGSLSDDAVRPRATVLWVRYAIPAANCSAQQALEVRCQQLEKNNTIIPWCQNCLGFCRCFESALRY